MRLSKKCQYALRAILELARHRDGEPVRTRTVAKAQGISPRFLEIILGELRQAGFVESRRGNEGGYLLARSPREITVGEVVRCVHGPITVVAEDGDSADDAAFGEEAFAKLWRDINQGISDLCDGRTFAELVELAERQEGTPDYVI